MTFTLNGIMITECCGRYLPCNLTGGSLRIFQLDLDVSIRPYQFFFVLAKVVIHYTATLTKRQRLVFVGFAC